MNTLRPNIYMLALAFIFTAFNAEASGESFAQRIYDLCQASTVRLIEESFPGSSHLFFPPPPSSTTVSVYVAAGMDDAEENRSSISGSYGAVNLTSSDLELSDDSGITQLVGLRFNGVAIPSGATITNAFVEFTTDAVQSGACNLTINGQAADNPPTFGNSPNNISSRAKTNASVEVSWNPAAWSTVNEKHQTPDISAIVQEIVNRGGWSDGNSLVIMIEGSGTREAESYNGANSHGDLTKAPRLVVEYSTSASFSCSSGLLTNPDFESGTTGWNPTGTTTVTSDAHFGSQAVVHSSSNGGIAQDYATTPGSAFSLSVFAKKSGTAEPIVGIKFFDASWNTLMDAYAVVTSATYEEYFISGIAPANTAWVQAIGWNSSGSGNAFFDGFCLEEWSVTPPSCSGTSCELQPSFNNYIWAMDDSGVDDAWREYDNGDLILCDNGDGTLSVKGNILNARDAAWGANDAAPCGALDGWYVDMTLSDMQIWEQFQGNQAVNASCPNAYLNLDYWDLTGTYTGIGCNAGRTVTFHPALGYRLQVGTGGNSQSCNFGMSTWFGGLENGNPFKSDLYAHIDSVCYYSMRPTAPNCNNNRLTNDEFDNGTNEWYLSLYSGNTGTFSVDNSSQLSGANAAFVDISSASGTNWHIQLAQYDLSVAAGQNYRMSFDAKATANRNIAVSLQRSDSPYTTFWWQDLALTTSSSNYSFDFTVDSSVVDQVALYFHFGEASDNVWIDNVSFTEICSGSGAEICDNGLDDDADGLVDCADPDCGTIANIDFETDANGVALNNSDDPSEEWAAWGVHFSSGDPVNHALSIFDSANPTQWELDAGTPNNDFGGNGVGAGGGSGMLGENSQALNKMLIISGGASPSQDIYWEGGMVIVDFDVATYVAGLEIVDIGHNEVDGRIRAYDGGGTLLKEQVVYGFGENSYQKLALQTGNVRRLEIDIPHSFALGSLLFCDDDLPTASIGDLVWNDANGDGSPAGESGISNVEVSLFDNSNNKIGETFTDNNGNYAFESLPTGQYRVAIAAPSGYTATHDLNGGNDNNSGVFTLAAGENKTNVDFGLTNGSAPPVNPSCTGSAGNIESETSGVTNSANALGDADGQYAEIYHASDLLVVDLGEVISSGDTYSVIWRRKSSYSDTQVADMVIEESADKVSWTTNPQTLSTSEKSNFIVTEVSTNINTRYLRLTIASDAGDDVDLDAILFNCDVPEICDNGIDDDGDGLVDNADPDCPDCTPSGVTGSSINPMVGNEGFQILAEGDFTLIEGPHIHGPLAVGGNLIINTPAQVDVNMDVVGSYIFPGDGSTSTGLLVGGGVTWGSGVVSVKNGKYIHIGNSTGCIESDNGTNMSTQVLPTGTSYNNANRIEGTVDQTPSPAVFQSGGLDISCLFDGYRVYSESMNTCPGNVQLMSMGNTAITNNDVTTSQDIKITSLATGTNFLDLTTASLSNITNIIFEGNGQPSSTKTLVINVPLTGDYVWNNCNMSGIGNSVAPYILWNFSGTTSYDLTINTAALILGTVYAPNHNLIKNGTGDIDGDIVAKTIQIGMGEIHFYPFASNITMCGASEICDNGIDDDGDGDIDEDDADCRCSSRVSDGLIALYEFNEGSGAAINDISAYGDGLTLEVQELSKVNWFGNCGISINSSTQISSGVPATKIIDAVKVSNQITIEAWVKPANNTQTGPARIVSISNGISIRNITLGQVGNNYGVRSRTSAPSTNINGLPELTSTGGVDTGNPQHVVYTFDASTSTEKIYVDGVELLSGTRPGDFSNWDDTYQLIIGNELTNDRPFIGDIYAVAIYNKVLSNSEINQNYGLNTCCGEGPVMDPDISCDEGVEIDLFYDGLANDIPKTINLSNPGNIDSALVEIVYKDNHVGSSLDILDNLGNTYTASMDSVGLSAYVYTVRIPSNVSSLTYQNETNESDAASMLVYAYRSGVLGKSYSSQFTVVGGARNTQALRINLPTRNDITDINIVLPISELTYDDRLLNFTATAGNNTINSTRTWGPSGDNFAGACCIDTVNFFFGNLPPDISDVYIDIESPDTTGQSYVVAGIVQAELICNSVEICDNDLDDDGDGAIDCADTDCPCFNGELEFCTYNLELAFNETFNIRDYVHDKDDPSAILDWSQIYFTYTAAGANNPTTPNDWHLADFNNGNDVTVTAADAAPGTGNDGDGEYRIYLVRNGETDFDDKMRIRISASDSNKEEAKCNDGSEICDNGIDDDSDGLIDCADPECGPISSPGIVAGDEIFCSAYNAGQIIEHEAAQSSAGLIYRWEQSTDLIAWSIISGATGATYDPGMINSTTYFRRGVGSIGCAYFAYTNIIRKVVDPTMPICLDDPDWESGCDTTYTVSSSGDGIKGLSDPGVRVLNPTFYEYYIAKAVFSGGANAPNSVIFTNEDGVQQTANKIYFEGESGVNGNRYFQAILPATDSVFVSYNGDAATAEALVVLSVQKNTHRISFGDFIHRSIAPGETITFNYQLPAQLNQRDVYVNIPFSGLVDDGTELVVSVEANGIIDSETITTYDDGNSLNISYLRIEDISQNETTVTVTISSPSVNGKTALVSGAVAGLAICDDELVVLVDSDANCPTVGDTIHYTYTLINFADYYVAYLNNNSTSSLTGAIDFGVDTIFGNSQIVIYENYVVTPADLPGPLINDVRAMGNNFAENGFKPIWDSVIDSIDINCNEICDNGIDDDGDDLIDCADPSCHRIDITNVVVSPCIDHPLQDISTLSIDVAWTNAPTNDTIEVSIYGKTERIDVAGGASSPQTVVFTVPADGSTGNIITASWRVDSTLCAESATYDAPIACSNDQIACNILYLCGNDKPYDGYAWDYGWIEYLDEVNGSATVTPILTKNEAGMGTYDPMNPSSFINVNLDDYGLVVVSATTEGHISTDLVVALKDVEGSVLLSNYQLVNDFGMAVVEATYSWQSHAYIVNANSKVLYNFNNDISPWAGRLFTQADYSNNADAYLWTSAAGQANGDDGVFFVYEGADALPGVAANHGTRVFLGYHMNGFHANDENGGIVPAPAEAWFDPAKHLTLDGKFYFDQALREAAVSCNVELCNNGIDDDGDNLVDCDDPDCELPTINTVVPEAPNNCPAVDNGQITINGSGSNLEYSIDGGLTYQSSNVFSNLSAGFFTIRIRINGSSCFVDYDNNPVVLSEPLCTEICDNGIDDDGDDLIDCDDPDCGPTVFAGTDLNICVGTTYTISAQGSGGEEPYSYVWNIGAGQEQDVTPAIGVHTYTVTLTDDNGCTSTDVMEITVSNCAEECADGIDNDGDDLIDCDDPDCTAYGKPRPLYDNYISCPGIDFMEQVIFNDDNLQNPVFSIYDNPTYGSVSINNDGVFTYSPYSTTCGTDVFIYEVCNQVTGCCDTASVFIQLGDTEAPLLQNLPADITISCDESIPVIPISVYGEDNCPGIYVSFDEESNQPNPGSCQTYEIHRTWTVTDLCGNSRAGTQIITVLDEEEPEIFRVYTLENGSKIMGGISTRVTEKWKFVEYPVNFQNVPVVFAQVNSDNESTAVNCRVRNVSVEGFELRLQEEENQDGDHAGEQVAWMAVEKGNLGDDTNLQVDELLNATSNASILGYANTFTGLPVFIGSLQTYNEADPVAVKFANASPSTINVFLEEETSGDTEVAHGNENMGYFAIEPGMLLDNEDVFIGESGSLSLNGNNQTIQLSRIYSKPVVIFGGIQSGTDPSIVRVSNVTPNSFDVRIQEWENYNGTLGKRTVGYFVMEGSIPAASEHFCSNTQVVLEPGTNLFAVDNCDNQLNFVYEETSETTESGMHVHRSWTCEDDCGNGVDITRTDTCVLAAARLSVFLGGALIGTADNLMRDDLRKWGYLPLQEPYTDLPGFHHKGMGGGETTTQEILDVTGQDAIVDWVFVEIRTNHNPEEVLATSSALLQRDGDVVRADGEPVIFFPTLNEENYFVTIRHRNHLGLMTKYEKYLSTNAVPEVMFGEMETDVNGDYEAGNEINGSYRKCWAGDLNGDGKVIYQGPANDVFSLFSTVLSSEGNDDYLANFIRFGYTSQDLDMNGKAIYQGPGNDRSHILYNTILVHPGNGNFLGNFIVKGTLP